MDVFISYKKGNKVKRLSNIQFTEINVPENKFYYWEFGGGDSPKSVNLSLVREIKVNDVATEQTVGLNKDILQ